MPDDLRRDSTTPGGLRLEEFHDGPPRSRAVHAWYGAQAYSRDSLFDVGRGSEGEGDRATPPGFVFSPPSWLLLIPSIVVRHALRVAKLR